MRRGRVEPLKKDGYYSRTTLLIASVKTSTMGLSSEEDPTEPVLSNTLFAHSSITMRPRSYTLSIWLLPNAADAGPDRFVDVRGFILPEAILSWERGDESRAVEDPQP